MSLVSDTGDHAIDLLTRDATLRIGGLEPGATWRFSVDGGQTWLAGAGDRVPADSFTKDGAQSVLVDQADAAGNRSPQTRFDFTLDTQAPQFTLRLLHDSGEPADAGHDDQTLMDRTTRVATVLVAGLESNRTWAYSLDGTTWTEGASDHTIDASAFGTSDGQKIVHVRQTDAAGNTGTATLEFTLDQTPPAPARIQVYESNPILGLQQPGDTTVTRNPWVHVSAEPGLYWTYAFDTGQRGSGRGTGDTPSHADLPEGQRTVTVQVHDSAGNVATSSFSFTLDRTPPAALQLALADDTGVSAADGLTRDGTIRVSGLEPGAIWYYRVSDAQGQGDLPPWTQGDPITRTIDPSALGADGRKRIDVLQMDAAGNLQPGDGTSLFIDLDRQGPAALTVSLASDTGELATDRVTRDATLSVGGHEPGAAWRFSVDGGQTWQAGTGDRIPADLFQRDGAQSVLVEQFDAAGNRSEATKFDFTLDTRAPMLFASLLVDTAASAAADPDNQTFTDRVTRNATVMIDGLEPGRPWQFSLDGVTWREGGARHQIDGSLFGADGAKIVHVRQADAAGNIGETELSFTLVRDIDPATIQVYDRNAFTETYRPGSSTLTSVPRVHITAEPGSYWTYEFDTGERGSGRGTASTDPLWSLREGVRTVTVRVEDGAGNVRTSQMTFTLDLTSPGPLGLRLVNDTGASATDGITQDGTLAVSGLKPGDKWYYRVSRLDLGDVVPWTAGDLETMTIPASALGADGRKRVDVIPVDPAGNLNQADMATLWIELDRHADAPLLALKHDTGGSAVDLVTADSTVVISAETGATLSGWSVRPGQSSVDLSEALAAAQAPGEALVTGLGDKRLQVRQTDLAGNVSGWSTLSWTETTAEVADGTRVTLNNRPDQGRTVLSGTRDADTFAWAPKTISYTPTDVVTNYKASEGDVLDLSRILTIAPGKALSDYLTKGVPPVGERVELFIHQAGQQVSDYYIDLWNTTSTDAIRIQTADGIFTI